MDIDKYLKKVNDDLVYMGCRYKIEKRSSGWLGLRGMVNREDGKRIQSRISLKMKGFDKASIDEAKRRAIELGKTPTGRPNIINEHDYVKIKFASFYGADIEVNLGDGLKCDIVGDRFVGEVKTGNATNNHLNQLLRYMAKAKVKEGYLVAKGFQKSVMETVSALREHGIIVIPTEYTLTLSSDLVYDAMLKKQAS